MNKHILVIDDNESICEAIKGMLEMEGYQITTRTAGKAAIS